MTAQTAQLILVGFMRATSYIEQGQLSQSDPATARLVQDPARQHEWDRLLKPLKGGL